MAQDTVSQTQQNKQEPKHNLKYCTFMFEILDNDWCTPTTAIVYFFMLNRYQHFKKLGKDYYETQKDIVLGTRASEKTVKTCIKVLKDRGYLTVSKHKSSNQQYANNTYVVLDKFNLFSNNSELAKKAKIYDSRTDEDLDNLPF